MRSHYQARKSPLVATPANSDVTSSPLGSASGIPADLDRGRTEAATRQLLASIVESSDDAIFSEDMNGAINSWNEGATRIFGYTAQEAIGKSIGILMPADRAGEGMRILNRIRKGERVEHFETVRKTKDGSLVNISLTVSPIRDAEGNIIGASKIARNITDQKRVQIELAEQREHLRVMLRSIGEGVIATDQSGTVTYLNSVAEHLTGWRNAEAVGCPLREVFRIVNEEGHLLLRNPVEDVLRKGHAIGRENDSILLGKDQVSRAIESNAAPIRSDHGKITGVVLVFRDVTERRAKQRLQNQAEELLRINEELSRFSFVVSHDLREPLRNITIFSELLVQECQDRPRAQKALGLIVDGVQRMGALVQDLLDYSHIGTSVQPPMDFVDMNEILYTALTNLHASIVETGAEVSSGHLPAVPGHRSQLLQVFQNLISNAIKYRSHAPPNILIRAAHRDNECLFSVRDNGIGIDPKHHQSIFDVFKRLHGKEIPGTGIGLAICSKVVKSHGGKLWVESQRGQGSEFFFILPTILPSAEHPTSPSPTLGTAPPSPQL